MFEYLIIAAIGLVASFFGNLAGGGSSLISVPLLLLTGLNPHIAVGTTKMGAIGSISGLYKYIKAKKIVWKDVLPLLILSILGAFFGSQLLISISPEAVKKVISLAILIALPFIFLKKDVGLVFQERKKYWVYLGYLLYFLIAIFQAAFGAGGGLIASYILMICFGYTIIEANATRRIPLQVMNLIVFVILASQGLVHYGYGIALIIGNLLGSYIGAHVAIQKGNLFVKVLFSFAVIASAVKILL